MRTSNDQYIDNRLMNGYDYINQAWVLGGVYVKCGHPQEMNCNCYGTANEGKPTPENKKLDGSEA